MTNKKTNKEQLLDTITEFLSSVSTQINMVQVKANLAIAKSLNEYQASLICDAAKEDQDLVRFDNVFNMDLHDFKLTFGRFNRKSGQFERFSLQSKPEYAPFHYRWDF